MKKKNAMNMGGLTENRAVLQEIGTAMRALIEAGRPIHTKALIDVLTGMSQATRKAEQRESVNTAIQILKNQHARHGQYPPIRML